MVFYDPLNVMSYAMARLKSDSLYRYRSADPRQPPHLIETEADLRDMLGDEHHHKLISKGGSWWLHTEIARAKAKGDQKTATKLQAEADKRLRKLSAALAPTAHRLGEGVALGRKR